MGIAAKNKSLKVVPVKRNSQKLLKPTTKRIIGSANSIPLKKNSVDLVVTSPPYWMKRDYGFPEQIGQEPTPDEYVSAIIECMESWRNLLAPWGSIFLNVGDTYLKGGLAGVPARLEIAALNSGWILKNRIIWAKEGGIPDPAKFRLKNKYEYIFHFTKQKDYYYDQFGYSMKYSNGTTPGDVWTFGLKRDMSTHLAPYPIELVERALTLACPKEVCTKCGKPRTRIVERTAELDASRPQAKRAMELAKKHGLTAGHIAAIQATGISDAGKALKVQNGTGRNSAEVKKLAAEAKEILGGYFREFTFAKKKDAGWSKCECKAPHRPGVVLDPFMGTGTTLRAAKNMDLSSIGVDFVDHSKN